jgi:protein-disulfide isomerase
VSNEVKHNDDQTDNTPTDVEAAQEPTTTPSQADTPSQKEQQVMTISVSILNYALVAVVFLFVGVLIGSQALGPQQPALSAGMVEQIVRDVIADADLSGGGDADSDRFELVDDDPSLGADDAPVVIVEFSDFRCPYCGRHYEQTLEPLLENYGEHIRYVYRDFAALGPESTAAALAAECADDQGAFWEFHDRFFTNQNQLSREYYIATAEDLELDVETFTNCVDEQTHMGEVSNDGIDGQLNGVAGTPGFFINGQFIRGAQPYEVFERVVTRELEKAGIDYSQTS